jgi:diacylglycerol kinase (ATP)
VSSPFGPLILICNPRAGGGGAKRALPEVLQQLGRRGLEHEVRYTEGPGHAVELARGAIDDGHRLIVAVGGDGTVHEVVNGMIENDRARDDRIVLGIIAAGTGCDFIRTFGIPHTPGHAVVHLDGPESFPIDVGKITCESAAGPRVRYFVNVAEAGLGADVARRAARLPRWLGPTVYPFAFWWALARHRPTEVAVDLVDRAYEGSMSNLVVANGQFYAAGMKIAPKAAPTDGLLDIQIQHPSKPEALALLPKVYRGEHVPHPDILEAKRVKVAIDARVPLPIEADGELIGHTPATFELLRNALHLKV